MNGWFVWFSCGWIYQSHGSYPGPMGKKGGLLFWVPLHPRVPREFSFPNFLILSYIATWALHFFGFILGDLQSCILPKQMSQWLSETRAFFIACPSRFTDNSSNVSPICIGIYEVLMVGVQDTPSFRKFRDYFVGICPASRCIGALSVASLLGGMVNQKKVRNCNQRKQHRRTTNNLK